MTSQPFSFKKKKWVEPIKPQKCSLGKGGVKTRTKEGGWIYYLNSSKELVLIALRILCDGKTTVLKGWRGGCGSTCTHRRVSMVEREGGGGGGEEIFAMAEVRVIILKFR